MCFPDPEHTSPECTRCASPLRSSDDELMELVSRSMPPETKLAVFDAVTSNTAVVLPIQRLVELCKSR